MPSTYTESGLELIASGEQSGTWGDTTNTNWQIVDRLTGARLSKTLSAAGSSGSPTDITISDGTLSEGMYPSIDFVDGADLGATAYVRLTPNDAERLIWVRNSLSGSRSILLFQGTYNASNDLELVNGYDYLVHFDGAGSGAVVTQVNAAFPAATFNLTEAELSQLQNIDSSTISATQWGYLGATDQALATTDGPTFAGAALSDSLDLNATLQISDAINYDGSSIFYVRSRFNGGEVQIGTETSGGTLYYPIVIDGADDELRLNNSSGEMARFGSDGNLGLGDTDTNYPFGVVGTNTNANTGYVVNVHDDTAQTTGAGGGISFSGEDGSGTKRAYAAIKGKKGNSTASNFDGGLALLVRRTGVGTLDEALTIDKDGHVSIGANIDVDGVAYLDNIRGPDSGYTIGGDTDNLGAALQLYPTSGQVRAYIDGAESMRLTSAGLGIGTTAPTFGQGGGIEIHHATAANLRLERTAATTSAMEIVAGDGLCEIDVRTAADLAFSTSNTERMRIDSAGVVSMTTSLEIGAGVSVEISGWDSGDTDIDGLVPGTAFGGLIEGRTNGHIVLGIRGNDALDGVHVLSGGGNYSSDTTYDTKVISFMANGEVVLGSHDSARGDALFDADSGPIVVTPIPYSTSQDATAIIFSASNFNNTTTNWGTEGLRLRLATTSGGVPRLIFDMANDGDLLHLTADGTGRVGIKEADPTCELHVDGAMRGGVYVGTEQSGTLTIASRNALVDMNGTTTIPASVFAEGDVIILYSSSASRTVNQGSGLTMHLDGTATTGNRTLAQRSMATIYFETATRCVISGGGVT